MKCLFAYPNKVNSPTIPQFPSFPIFCHVTLIKRKKTSRFTIGENNHFVLGLLVRDIANHSYAQNTPLTQAWTPWELLEVLHPGINFVFIVPSSFESSIQKNGAGKSNVSRITLYYSFKIFEITFQNTSFFIKRDGFFPLQASQLFTR